MSTASTLKTIFGGASYRKTSSYGMRIHPITKKKRMHYGVDYGCGKVPVYALESGTVYKRGYDSGAGNYVYVKYPRLGVAVAYFHLSRISVAKGQHVKKGTQIGIAGQTGSATGVHLHIGVRNLSTWKWQNPETWLANYKPPGASGGETADYRAGGNYVLQVNLKVRTGAGTKYRQKKRSELTADGRKHALSGTDAVLKKGTTVTCQTVKKQGNDIWLRIPSGWICAKQGSKVYVK